MNQLDSRNKLGIIIIGIGVLLLGIRFFDFGGLWPLTILLPGLALLGFGISGEKLNMPMLMAGTVVTTTGVLLAGMNITDRWESWAYMWAAYPTAVGIALSYAGKRMNDATLSANGRRTMIAGTGMLAIFGIMFEVFIFEGVGFPFSDSLIAVALVVVGAYLLLTRDEKQKRKHHE